MEKILRTREDFLEATRGSIIDLNESHAIWMDRIFGKALDAADHLGAAQDIVHSAGDDPEWNRPRRMNACRVRERGMQTH